MGNTKNKDFSGSQEVLLLKNICKILLRQEFYLYLFTWDKDRNDMPEDGYYLHPKAIAVESILSDEHGAAHEFRIYFDSPPGAFYTRESDSTKEEFKEVTDNIMKRFKRGMYSCRICFEPVRTDLSYVMFVDGTVINNFKSLQENLLEAEHTTPPYNKVIQFIDNHFTGKKVHFSDSLKSSGGRRLNAEISFDVIKFENKDFPTLYIKNFSGKWVSEPPFQDRANEGEIKFAGAICCNLLGTFFRKYEKVLNTGLALIIKHEGTKEENNIFFMHSKARKIIDNQEPDDKLFEEVKATESQKLLKLKSVLSRTHNVEVVKGYFCNFTVEYIFPIDMRNNQEMVKTIAMVVNIKDGYIVISDSSKPTELDDFVAETLDGSTCTSLPLLCNKIKPYLNGITHIFGYDYVHIEKFKFVDESNS
jgi:hypothetical protein